ncbi:ABC transporter ATP-binding protein [Kordiimonas pumila]|uniref:ABC transporter ATP-binding protein n=1 Tax=Kordiimonas pumila TaxID=2161677 RepID=A0ABV7D2P0_9PROT|nr:ABC transporter ATP-binding protein [Kordiimonas pumila]
MLMVSNAYFAHKGQPDTIRGISFSAQKGEIISLVGASGCGKSTLLRIIAGLLPSNIQHSAGQCAFVFQDAALMPWATVNKNVALPLRLASKKNPDAIDKALLAVGMNSYSNRYPSELSGGQRMRVSIARALVSKPSLLLLDEPFAALDELLRFQMNELILQLRTELQFSCVFVTHSIYEACYLADRVLVMKEGKIFAEVEPNLDRNLLPLEQRSLPQFAKSVTEVSAALAEGAHT